MNLKETAESNLLCLKNNLYPGRGLIMGVSADGYSLVQVYWIMGRSENSRNRIFVAEDKGVLKTAPADPSKVKDPSLIIYTAMLEYEGLFAVSNGAQTEDAITDFTLLDVMLRWNYEPDVPNYTPRITGLFNAADVINPHHTERANHFGEICVIKRSPEGEFSNHCYYRLLNWTPGIGYCVTTYSGDGDPLPSFQGEPYLLPLGGSPEETAEKIWQSLNEENRISLAVKFINPGTWKSKMHIINKYQAV